MRVLLMIFMICLVSPGCQLVSPERILPPFATSTPQVSAPRKQVTLNTLPLVERWRWSGNIDDLSISLPVGATTEGRIVIIRREGADQRVTVFDANTGNHIWKSGVIIRNVVRSLAVDEKRVYIGTITDVQAFDLETGQKLWRGAEQPSMKRGGLVVSAKKNQLEVYDILEPMVYVLDAATGQMIEEIPKNFSFP